MQIWRKKFLLNIFDCYHSILGNGNSSCPQEQNYLRSQLTLSNVKNVREREIGSLLMLNPWDVCLAPFLYLCLRFRFRFRLPLWNETCSNLNKVSFKLFTFLPQRYFRPNGKYLYSISIDCQNFRSKSKPKSFLAFEVFIITPN